MTPVRAASPCDPPVTSIIACENSKPGNPESEWDVTGAGDTSIQGFTTDVSVNVGGTVGFKVNTNARSYVLNIYRVGYYGGAGARKIATVSPSVGLPQSQPACINQSSTTGLVDCGNWALSASWSVPSTAVSGVYIARLVRSDTGGASHILFVVRDDSSHSDLLLQTSDTTWTAYNSYGGNSLYVGQPAGRAYKVSYNRPLILRGDQYMRANFFANEYPMVRWLESNGYDVSYTSGVDTERAGARIQQHGTFISSGHDEYWSGGQRANVEAARDAGVNLAFFSGNEVFWKTRWENSVDASSTAYRTLVTYKETKAGAKIDPNPAWTGTWRDPRFSPPADGGRPENGLTGTIFTVNCCWAASIKVPEDDGKLRFWRGTSVASQPTGGVATLAAGTLGYEWDEDLDNGSRPAGLVGLSSTTIDVSQKLLDFGDTYGNGRATHRLTLYGAPSGALVFGAGTVRWSWGLDEVHDDGSSTADVRMQQATVNLLADMDAQPATIQAGLTAASKTSDTTAPTASITAPAAGASYTNGSTITVVGTASDGGGGRVGGVEVSLDGGASWHPATGRQSWSYSGRATGLGPTTVKARATDDSGNISPTPASVNVTVNCPCSLFATSAVPTVTSSSEAAALELGVKFSSDVNGSVTGVRFYKGTGNTGTHTGTLWTSGGTRLATATFTAETGSGWQQVTFPSPVAISAGATYVASYYTPSGRYAVDGNYFAVAVDSPPLHAVKSTANSGNGVYFYGAGFPYQSYNASNYWVDVVFTASTTPDTVAPTVTSTSPAAGANGVATGAKPQATFSEAV
ncbi:MAG TPA: N,N-dimethylformamidase beta subunit family domain-containing protein, partial [Acidimicrobiales bacterium]|nr:N,N-dimethylformamidase beta subunit family domain-containing protein [Acidimicrobiales bacterium]